MMKTNWVRRFAAESGYTLVLLFYNLAFLLVLAVTSPLWLLRKSAADRNRDGLSERLGKLPHHIAIRREDRSLPVIWLHAVSVGEVLAISHLVSEWDWAFPGFRLLISTTTDTGN